MQKENKVLGIVGAIIGTILGLVVWCIIGMMGYISWIGGLALAAGAFFGYQLLGKGFSPVGAVVCLVLVLGSVWVGTRITYAIEMRSSFKEEEAVGIVAEALYDLDDDPSTVEILLHYGDYEEFFDDILDAANQDTVSDLFKRDLIVGYVFTVLATVVLAANAVKKR